MEIVRNETYIVIKLLPIEVNFLGWGNLCSNCNKEISGSIYYIPVLNDLMDKECVEKWYKDAEYFPEDKKYEIHYINSLIYNLRNLTYSK
jgi:hypothetical protein